MSDRLDVMLGSLATEIEWPEPSTGFPARVVSRIEAEPAPRRQRRLLPAFGAAFAIAVLALTVSPASRDAVADFLGIGGVRISFGDEPTHTPRPSSDLDLGHLVSLEEARAEVDFHVFVPTELGEPSETYYDPIVPGGMVSLVYPSSVDVKVLITEFEGQLESDGLFFKKMMGPESDVRAIDVGGDEGYWVSGAHVFTYRTGGTIHEERVRLVENVLLWVRDGVTLRIETAGSLDQALRIAGSFR
jgi:hypothetical protein